MEVDASRCASGLFVSGAIHPNQRMLASLGIRRHVREGSSIGRVEKRNQVYDGRPKTIRVHHPGEDGDRWTGHRQANRVERHRHQRASLEVDDVSRRDESSTDTAKVERSSLAGFQQLNAYLGL